MKKLLLLNLFMFLQYYPIYCQTTKTITFGTNGRIEIPSDFKNADLISNSSKIVVVKANLNIEGYNFYIKFSYSQLEKSYTIQELKNSKGMIFDKLTQDLENTRIGVSKLGTTILETSPNQIVSIDKAYGGLYSYTYKNQRIPEERKTIIYQIYYLDKLYFLTFGWSKEIEVKSQVLLQNIVSSIVF